MDTAAGLQRVLRRPGGSEAATPRAGLRGAPAWSASWDIGVSLLLAAVLWGAVSLWPEAGGAWRVTLGLVVTLAVPGHLLVSALFPRADDLDGLARATLALVLGAGVVILIALGLAEVHLRLTAASATGGMFAVSAVFGGVAAWRRHRLRPDLRLHIPMPRSPGFWGVLGLAVGLAVLTAVVVGGALRQRSVAFFVTGPNGHLEGYPYQVPLHTVYRLGLHVSDPTPQPFVGEVTATANGGRPFLRRTVRLPPHGRWFAWVQLPNGPATGHEVVRFYLYRGGGKALARRLWIRYTVVP